MLLLTAVTYGGSEAPAALEHLPQDESELLKHRAAQMMEIPREKRIPLLVQEIKRAFSTRRKHLQAADPERLAHILFRERASLVEVVMRALPSNIEEQVRGRLPRRELTLLREVKPAILDIVRWKLEENMLRGVPKKGVFKFSDVLILQSRELLTVCDRMGARALATAIAGLPEKEREAFFGALPPDQRVLAQRASEAGRSRALAVSDAKAVLEMHGAIKHPSLGMRSAGTQRFARACLAQSPEFAMRVLERHSGEFGKLLARWVKEEAKRTTVRGDGGRGDIVEQLERLAHKGVIDRPMRLPPPDRRPLGPAAAQLPGGQLLPPRPKLSPAHDPRQPVVSSPVRVPERGASSDRRPAVPQLPVRDPIAERHARMAGAVSSRQFPRSDPMAERERRRAGAAPGAPAAPREEEQERQRYAPRDPRAGPLQSLPHRRDPAREMTNPRILRDGKPMEYNRPPPAERARPVASPALQKLPTRRGPAPGGTQVGRPSRQSNSGRPPSIIKGPNRGPGSGSG